MILSIRRTPLKPDIERYNNLRILRSKQRLLEHIVKILNAGPDSFMVKIIHEAILKNLKVLKTKNKELLNISNIVLKEFKIRIIKCE